MNSLPSSDLPPTDLVTFLAQRSGLSNEAAARRLESWFGEYQASVAKKPSRAVPEQRVSVSTLTS
ncbi:MAG TPA: hypothetical protein VHV51_04720 [Polyangiaceae bacterium]|jgi:hypothetical protein|nr:hypothetical protein [Polyangiaceae bacterium]